MRCSISIFLLLRQSDHVFANPLGLRQDGLHGLFFRHEDFSVIGLFLCEVAFEVVIPDALGGEHVSGQYKPDLICRRAAGSYVSEHPCSFNLLSRRLWISCITSSEGSVEAQPKHARAASEHPPLPFFDKADLGHVVEPFHGEGNTGPIFAVRQVALESTKGPSWHRDFQPAGFDQAGIFILRVDGAIFHRLKGGLPGVVIAAHGKSLLHAA